MWNRNCLPLGASKFARNFWWVHFPIFSSMYLFTLIIVCLCFHEPSLTPPLCIGVPVSSQESYRSCRCVLGKSIFPLSTIFLDCILKLFRQCGILKLFRKCGIFRFSFYFFYLLFLFFSLSVFGYYFFFLNTSVYLLSFMVIINNIESAYLFQIHFFKPLVDT